MTVETVEQIFHKELEVKEKAATVKETFDTFMAH
jgi:hypothetical protein